MANELFRIDAIFRDPVAYASVPFNPKACGVLLPFVRLVK
jgi:hypothetical protein